MKSFSVLIAVFCLSYLFGQNEGHDSTLVSRHRPGIMWFNSGWRPAKEGAGSKYDRFMIDLNYTLWTDKKIVDTEVQGSFGWALHGMWDVPLNKRNTVSLGWGLSYKNQRVGLKSPLQIDESGDIIKYNPDSLDNNTSRSLLKSHVFQLPLELRFRKGTWQHLKLHFGGYLGYRVGAKTKIWANGDKRKQNLGSASNGLVYGIHLRFGIRNWALFADYGLSYQFNHELSTKLNPFTFGVTFSFF